MAPKAAGKAANRGKAAAAPSHAASLPLPSPVALIITDTFSDEMQPLTTDKPRALMPVCNVPLIEYALELLVVNGIRDVRVVTYFGTQQIHDHLSTTVTHTGKTWTNSSELALTLIKGSSGVNSFSEALRDVLHKNQLPEHFLVMPIDTLTSCRNLTHIYHTHVQRVRRNPKLIATLALAEAPTQLLDVHNAVVERAAQRDRRELSPTSTMYEGTGSWSTLDLSMDPTNSVVSPSSHLEFCTVAYSPKEECAVTQYQSWLDNERKVAQGLREHAPSLAAAAGLAASASKFNGEAIKNAGIELILKPGASDILVRTDVVNTGIYVMTNTLVSEILQNEAMLRDVNDILRHLVDNPAYCQSQFTVEFLASEAQTSLGTLHGQSPLPSAMPTPFTRSFNASPRPEGGLSPTVLTGAAFGASFSTNFRPPTPTRDLTSGPQHRPPCVVPVKSVTGLIDASVAVCERRLFPFTRESNFAEKEPVYTVWRHLPNVYVHARAGCRLSAHMALGPNVVVGEACQIAPNAVVSSTTLGNRVTIGEHAVLVHCVVMDGATIAAGCSLNRVVVGCGASIAVPQFQADHAVIGDNVIVAPHANRAAPLWPSGVRIFARGNESDAQYVGAKGRGVRHPRSIEELPPTTHADDDPRVPHFTAATLFEGGIALDVLFARDQQPGAQGESEFSASDEELDPREQLLEVVVGDIDEVVQSVSHFETIFSQWRQWMIHNQCNIDDLLCVVTRALVECVGGKLKGDEPKAASKALCTVVKRLCAPFYRELIRKRGSLRTADMHGVLRGLALGLASNNAAVLRPKAANVLSCFYASADKALFEAEGYCIVSYEAILSFDDFVTNQPSEAANAFDQELVVKGWAALQEYVAELRG